MITEIGLWGGAAQPSCLLKSFGLQAERRRADLAVADAGQQLTFGDLTRWIACIAALLDKAGISAEDPVAVAGPRSAAVVATMWAVVGAGAIYIPLDSSYPRKRLAYMLADSGAKVVLHSGPEPALPGVPAVRIPDWTEIGCSARSHLRFVDCNPGAAVYVIYTSGTTGQPKGVALPHRSIDNMADWQRHHSVRQDLRTAQFAPLNFDVWFQEVLGTLCGGGLLVIMPEALRQDPFALLDWLAYERIERLFLPCVALHMLAAAAAERESVANLALREINTAGEQLVCTPTIRDFFSRLPQCRLNNHYGQSESAMVTVHTLAGPSVSWPTLPPIGLPLPGCEVLIDAVDSAHPRIGELLVAGLPLSTGYLNRPELNAERYARIPRTARGHTVAFRTGDLVDVESEVIQFLGRADHEVKIRGFRVNPIEVDACLSEQPGVAEAICVPVDLSSGARQLRAGVTVADGRDFDPASALAALRELLPSHSVPLSIAVLATMPRTPSGKVDRAEVARMLAPARRAGS